MIKVLQFIPGYNFGGIETVFENTYNSIDSDSIKIDLMVESLANKESIARLKEMGCTVHVLPRFKDTEIWWIL